MNDPLAPHSHEPNLVLPPDNSDIVVTWPGGGHVLGLADLAGLPGTELADCTIASTGHPSSGPFTFGGVTLADLVAPQFMGRYSAVEIISADGFGTRVGANELSTDGSQRPILLAYEIEGMLMTRAQGVVRLIVPSETDDALRQVKWVVSINLVP